MSSKNEIEGLKLEARSAHDQSASEQDSLAREEPSAADELWKFAALTECGVVSDDEFEQVKRKLLNT